MTKVMEEWEEMCDKCVWIHKIGTECKPNDSTNQKVWGESEGLCAWCNAKAQTSYTGEQAGGKLVEYQVCNPCDKEMN